MDYRNLGRTGVKVSSLCLGAMMFGSWGNPDHDDSVNIIHRALDAGINFIDLYQIHRPEPDCDIDDTLGALTDLVHAGKIRYFGSSTFPAHQVVEAQWVAERRGHGKFSTEQPPYSILARGIEAAVLPVCQDYGLG